MGPLLRKLVGWSRVWDYLLNGWAGLVETFSEPRPSHSENLSKRLRLNFDLSNLILERRMMPSYGLETVGDTGQRISTFGGNEYTPQVPSSFGGAWGQGILGQIQANTGWTTATISAAIPVPPGNEQSAPPHNE